MTDNSSTGSSKNSSKNAPSSGTQGAQKDPLHGVSLETIVRELEQRFGWDGLAQRIDINCFKKDPSVKSSLKFLRKTPWARSKVEALYVRTCSAQKSRKKDADRSAKKAAKQPARKSSPSQDSKGKPNSDPWAAHRE